VLRYLILLSVATHLGCRQLMQGTIELNREQWVVTLVGHNEVEMRTQTKTEKIVWDSAARDRENVSDMHFGEDVSVVDIGNLLQAVVGDFLVVVE